MLIESETKEPLARVTIFIYIHEEVYTPQSLFTSLNSTGGLLQAAAILHLVFVKVTFEEKKQKRHLAEGPDKGQVNQFGSNYSHWLRDNLRILAFSNECEELFMKTVF